MRFDTGIRFGPRGWVGAASSVALLALTPLPALAGGRASVLPGGLGGELPLWTCLPFVGILLSIALFPLLAPRFWHRHFPKVSAFWALAFAVPFLFARGGEAAYEIFYVYIIDYIPFIILLWSLFTVTGGILVRGTLQGSPALNCGLLAIGTVLASWVGTTGASMVMIRPVLRANAWRKKRAHVVVFFIFLVSNIGGALTPLGDPPLFLGFLHGVPFFWTLHLLPPMLVVSVPLLVIFYLIDWLYYRKEKRQGRIEREPIRIDGMHNFLLLGGIVGAVLMSGTWKLGAVAILGIEQQVQFLIRDGIMILVGFVSLWTTREEIHRGNEFSWFPIKEVGILFAAIFMTIIPALAILKAGEHGALGGAMQALATPMHYYWSTGFLSSFLDNAPTYLTFMNSVLGKFYSGLPESQAVPALILENAHYLLAVSTGAVFFGAMTYIGNAPNFMVKSIAEEAGVPMPSFFGYMFKYSLAILLPLYFVVMLVFFR